jgi:hypothetical protein
MTDIKTFVLPGAIALLALLVAMCCMTGFKGVDHEGYWIWASAACDADLSWVGTPINSDVKIPFCRLTSGPGLLISPFVWVSRLAAIESEAGLVAGIVCVVVFWINFYAGLKDLSDEATAVTACVVAMVATPIGYYCCAISSETYSLLPTGVLFRQAIIVMRGQPVNLPLVSLMTSILVMLRPYSGVYAWPVLIPAFCIASRRGTRACLLASATVAIPLILAVTQVGIVHNWMTGDWRVSPYSFSGAGFKSLNSSCPYLWHVLFDTFKGLLPTHPLMGVGFVALPGLCVLEMRLGHIREASVWGLGVVAIAANCYIQGCWYYWWMASVSLGMRGLTLSGILVIAAVCRVNFLCHSSPCRSIRFMPAIVVSGCVVWSWLLLVQGPMEYLEWSTLLSGQVEILQFWITDRWPLVAVSIATAVVLLRAGNDAEFEITAYIAGTLAFSWLANRHEFVTLPLITVYGIALVVVSTSRMAMHRVTSTHHTILAGLLLASMLGFFIRLAIPTQRLIQPVSPRETIPFPADFISAYQTLLTIPRLSDQRRTLEAFLQLKLGEEETQQIQALPDRFLRTSADPHRKLERGI